MVLKISYVLIFFISIADLALTTARSTTLPFNISNPPDVWLNVPNLNVDKISLIVKDLKAHVSLSANIGNLVSLNAGVDISIGKVNLTIKGIKAQVQLAMHLDNIVKIISRTMASLDLNPSLISVIDKSTLNNATSNVTVSP